METSDELGCGNDGCGDESVMTTNLSRARKAERAGPITVKKIVEKTVENRARNGGYLIAFKGNLGAGSP